MKKLLTLLLLSFVAGHLPTATHAQQQSAHHTLQKDKIKATKTVKGKFKGFEVGDYQHAVITKANGEEASFFLGRSESVPYFLVAHKGQTLTLTYQVVDSYIEEAGGVQTIERLVSIKAGTLTDAAWWKKERAGSSVSNLRKKYDAMVEQARLNP